MSSALRLAMFTGTCFCVLLVPSGSVSVEIPETFTNSIGLKFVRIGPGRLMMGQENGGHWDELPVHRVNITRPFYMAKTEVTNAQYEQFDREHRRYRGYNGFSIGDDEAVVFVGWHEANAFCEWLSEKEGKPYRLPTEAEWEHACRAGTTTPFHTGDELPPQYHKHQEMGWTHTPVSLQVGVTPPNAWGLYDMHGNVEEWCYDWYGPYEGEEQTDPVGRAGGIFKVTRGGSHNTDVRFLRSANRLGTLSEDKHWLIGFRVVMGELPKTKPLPVPEPPLCMRHVKQDTCDWTRGPDRDKPFFRGPIRFVNALPEGCGVPMYQHNHCPSITWCPNGDLLAVWYSTRSEKGREMVILGSRLRRGGEMWDPPSLFFKAPDRNMTGSSLFHDGEGTIYFVNGMEVAGTWEKLAVVMRISTDKGATWSAPRLINSYHQRRNQVIHGMIRTREGYLIQPCDAVPGGRGGTALHISRDGGLTWEEATNSGLGMSGEEGQIGGWIAGIHAAVVQVRNGDLLALGRGDNINGRMPMSISADMGRTWTYSASDFPPISGGQRLVLMRLREGPVLLVSFTDASSKRNGPDGMLIRDATGKDRRVYGMFAAISFDEGKTWPLRKLITAGGRARELKGGAHTGGFVMDQTHAEPMGYLAATQTPDGVIHLISSALHYQFNLAWLKTRRLRRRLSRGSSLSKSR